jgi:hypothetical protein
VVVLILSFLYVFGGGFDWTVKKLGPSAPMGVMGIMVAAIFFLPRIIARFQKERFTISAFGVVWSRGPKKLETIPHDQIEGYRISNSKLGFGTYSGVEIVRKSPLSVFRIPEGSADPKELDAALGKFFTRI